MLPPVKSTTLAPGLSWPRASAPSIIESAIRSFMLPVGLAPSNFTKMSALPGSFSLSSLKSGVFPIVTTVVRGGQADDRVKLGEHLLRLGQAA